MKKLEPVMRIRVGLRHVAAVYDRRGFRRPPNYGGHRPRLQQSPSPKRQLKIESYRAADPTSRRTPLCLRTCSRNPVPFALALSSWNGAAQGAPLGSEAESLFHPRFRRPFHLDRRNNELLDPESIRILAHGHAIRMLSRIARARFDKMGKESSGNLLHSESLACSSRYSRRRGSDALWLLANLARLANQRPGFVVVRVRRHPRINGRRRARARLL